MSPAACTASNDSINNTGPSTHPIHEPVNTLTTLVGLEISVWLFYIRNIKSLQDIVS